MTRSRRLAALPLLALVTVGLGTAGLAPAARAATPSCVAKSTASEHDLYGPAWGHDQIAFLATHPDVLQEFGFQRFGELAAFAATQSHESCPRTSRASVAGGHQAREAR